MAKPKLGYMNPYVYDALLWMFSVLVDLFFREVHPRSSWKIPKDGPVLFVCAPHANQVRGLKCAFTETKVDFYHSLSIP